MPPDDPHDADPKLDVVFVHSKAKDGEGYDVVRAREGRLEVGRVKPVREGEPLEGDVVRLTRRSESDRLFDVKVVASRKELIGDRSGPAKVNSDAFRSNWEAIFAPRKAELPN